MWKLSTCRNCARFVTNTKVSHRHHLFTCTRSCSHIVKINDITYSTVVVCSQIVARKNTNRCKKRECSDTHTHATGVPKPASSAVYKSFAPRDYYVIINSPNTGSLVLYHLHAVVIKPMWPTSYNASCNHYVDTVYACVSKGQHARI